MCNLFQYLLLFLIVRLLLPYNKRVMLNGIGVGIGVWYVVEAVKCILQLLSIHPSNHDVFALTGHFDNPGPLGGFLSVVGTIAVTYLIINRKWCSKVARCFCWVVVALVVVLLPASMSRAAWVACGVAVLMCVLVEFNIGEFIKRHKVLSAVGFVVLVLLVVGSFYLKRDSALGRFHIWKMEMRAILDAPVWGYGQGMALGVYGETQAEYFKNGMGSEQDVAIAGCPEYAFNELLKIGVERGVLAMLLVLIIVLFCIIRLFSVHPPFAYGMQALCIFSLFSYPFSLWQFKVLFALFMAVALCNYSENRVLAGTDRVVSIILVGIMLSFSGECYDYHKSRKEAVEKWKSLGSMAAFDMYEEIAEGLEPLAPVLEDNYRYLYDYGYALHKCGKYIESNDILKKGARISSDPMFHNIIGKNYESMGLYSFAKEKYEYSHYMVPCRLYPLVLLEEVHLKLGAIEEAEKVLDKINRMPVNEKHRSMRDLKRRANNSYKKHLELCGN